MEVTPRRTTRASRHWMDPSQSWDRYHMSDTGSEYTTCGFCDRTFRTGPQCDCVPREKIIRVPEERAQAPLSPSSLRSLREHPLVALTRKANDKVLKATEKEAERRRREAARREREHRAELETREAELQARETNAMMVATRALINARRGDIPQTQISSS